jgi:hypothetical protein
MAGDRPPERNSDRPPVYQIRIRGHLGQQWLEWFEGMSFRLEDDGNTLLTGPIADQAALHGIFKKVRDLGIPLLSINPVEPEPPERPEANAGVETDRQPLDS